MHEVPLESALELLIDHRGKTPKKLGGDFTDAGVRVVSAIHIKDGRINWEARSRYVSDEMYERWMPQRTRRGDVLLTSEAPLGEVAQVPDDEPLVLSQRLFGLRGKSGVLDSSYLRYFLQSDTGRDRLLAHQSGSTVSGIRQALLRQVRIPLPGFIEQKRIVGVLTAFDDLIQINRLLAEDTIQLQRAVFQQASRSAPRVPLAEVIDVEMGQSPPGDTYNEVGEGLPFYQGVKDFGRRFPSRRVFCSSPRKVAQEGDLLLAVRAPIGLVNVATEECATGRGLAILRSTRPSTALQALTTERLWDAYQGEGTVFSAINAKAINTQRIPWVDDDDLESTLGALDELVLDCSEQVQNLTKQRDALLPMLLSGRVRVSELEGVG